MSSRQFLQIVERIAAIGTWAWEPATDVMIWSDSLHRLMRTDPSTHRPTMDEIIARAHPDDRWIVQERMRPDGPLDATPARMVFPDGSIRWQICHKEVVTTGGDGAQIMIGVIKDVTDAWTAQNLLLRRQRLFDTLVRLVGGILWRAEPSGALLFESGWCEFTGTTLAQNQGDRWLSALHPADRPGAVEAWRRAVDTHGLYSTVFRVRRDDGAYRAMQVKASPLLDSHGVVTEWLGYCVPTLDRNPPAPDRPAPDPARPGAAELKAARALLGLSVGDLAAASGVSIATITRHEAGDGAITIRASNLARLRAAFSARGLEFSADADGGWTLRFTPPRPAGRTLERPQNPTI